MARLRKSLPPAPVRRSKSPSPSRRSSSPSWGPSITPSEKNIVRRAQAETLLVSSVVLVFGLAFSVPTCDYLAALPGAAEFGLGWHNWSVALPDNFALWTVGAYVLMIMWHDQRSVESKATAQKWAAMPSSGMGTILVAWNFFLCALSLLMLVGNVRAASNIVVKNGGELSSLLCDGDSTWLPVPGKGIDMAWQLMFAWSKFPELFDTVLLVVRGRDVIFLHWYHHITVLLYCWFSMRIDNPAIFFGTMNAFVHSIMYYYYARMAQGVRPAFGQILTSLQLSQMVVGSCCAVYSIYLNRTDPEGCPGSTKMAADGGLLRDRMAAASVVMYGSYMVLFLRFFIKKYLTPVFKQVGSKTTAGKGKKCAKQSK